ncbi:hypothetical protein [Lentzea cavernae]|uniref:Uncharacterized protein n=1 Tax=Lentzea cavernae TaxID=2020703 RepID=A0ABQ3MG17_9PSEU|nr:hypothetical protein [Lentzea cavernae]GHH40597.1 hypothetical protein GCM10017774_34230 [Lentzea cavernae]
MSASQSPSSGSVITYLNPDAMHPDTYLRGVVAGPHVVDPETGHSWVPVLLPNRSTTVLDTVNIVRVRRPASRNAPPE